MVKGIKRNNVIWVLNRVLVVLPMFFWFILIFGFDEPLMAVITLAAAVLHECGHIGYLMMRKKVSPTLRGVLSGFRIKTKVIMSYREERAFYFAGPLVNLLLFAFASLLYPIFGEFCVIFALINLVSALSNLLPIEGYDGYGIIRATIKLHSNSELGIAVLSQISTFIIFLLAILSLYLINRLNGGYWIFFIFFFSMLKQFQRELG